jgi:hypothetical protein
MPSPNKPANSLDSSKSSLVISAIVHGVIVLALAYFAAREGMLGTQLKKFTVQLVKQKPREKPREAEKPKPPTVETPRAVQPQAAPPPAAKPPAQASTAPPSALPPVAAPPPAQLPGFNFDGGKPVLETTDPVLIYKSMAETFLRGNWDRPTELADDEFVAEVELSIDSTGRVSDPSWKRGSGNTRWDNSVRQAVARSSRISRPPPKDFPSRILVRFDVQDAIEGASQ